MDAVRSVARFLMADGSWGNDHREMREHDPLTSTPLAFMALGHWLVEDKVNMPRSIE